MSDFQSEPSSLDRTDRSVFPLAFSSVRRVKAKSRQKTVSALHVMNFSFQLKLKNVNKTNCFLHLQRLCFNECVGLENIRRCCVPGIPPSLQVLIFF